MVDTAAPTMKEIKVSVLEAMEPGESMDPIELIERLHQRTGISAYDLKAAIWYLIGEHRILLDHHLAVVRVDEAASG